MVKELREGLYFHSTDLNELAIAHKGKYIVWNSYVFHHVCDTEEEAIALCKSRENALDEIGPDEYMYLK